MNATEFCYWLQGYFEIAASGEQKEIALTPAQVAIVRNHLALAFKHDIDPKAGPPKYQQELQAVHDGNPLSPSWNRPSGPNGELMRC